MAEIAIALDVPELSGALDLVDALGDEADLYKVGLELFVRDGHAALRELRERDRRIFLDLKLHDIPNTVARSVEAASETGVEYLTVHTTGGAPMLRAAAEAAGDGITLLGVTVLTSFDGRELGRTWGRPAPEIGTEVVRLGEMAVECGLTGLVASAVETAELRSRLGEEVVLVTPGIRLPGGDAYDQARVATPSSAVRDGSDLLVIGRTVTAAADPVAALANVRRNMEEMEISETSDVGS